MGNDRRLRRLVAMALIAQGALASPAGASPADDDRGRLADLDVEQLMAIEVETVRTASKHEEELATAPASVTVVTADQIRDLGYRTLADVLAGVRGLFVRYDRNYAYLGFRGFDRPGDYNTRILLLVDGHAVNDDIYDYAPIGTEFVLDLDLVERVEVVRGPGSSLYGANALFGIVNVITRPASSFGGAEAAVEAGSFGTYRGRLSYGFTRGQFEAVLSLSGFRSGGQDLYYPEVAAPPASDGWARGLDWDRAGSFFAKASYRGLSLEVAGIQRDKGVPTGSYGTILHPRNETSDRRLYAELKLERPLGELETMLRAYYDESLFREWYAYPGPSGDPSAAVVNRDIQPGRWFGGEARALYRLGEHLMVAGAEAKRNVSQDFYNDDEGGPVYLDEHHSSTTFALFLQLEAQLLRGLRIDAGARYDHYETFGGMLSPRLAVIGAPWSGTVLKALYGRAFRPPNASELYYVNPQFWKLPGHLDPETIQTVELILEQRLTRTLQLTALAYWYDMRSLIGERLDPADGLFATANVGGVHARGLEAELEQRWASGFSARASYALQRAEDWDSGVGLTNSPTHLAKLQLHGPIIWTGLRGGLELLYMSSRKTVSGGEAEPHLVANATVLLPRLLGGPFDLSASVYNLFDSRYGDPGSGEHRQSLIAQDGRSLRLKVVGHF